MNSVQPNCKVVANEESKNNNNSTDCSNKNANCDVMSSSGTVTCLAERSNGALPDTIRSCGDEKDNTSNSLNKVNTDTDDDTMDWHDQQFQLSLEKKIENYVSSFTVHGLTRVFIGERIESMFWLVILFFGTILTVMVVYGLIVKYFRYDVYTEIRLKVTSENLFPSVTFCNHRKLMEKYFAYCGMPIMTGDEVSTSLNSSKVCQHNTKTTADIMNDSHRRVQSIEKRFWSNGFFNITSCYTWDGKICTSSKFFMSMQYFEDECIKFNYKGTLSDLYTHVNINFEYTDRKEDTDEDHTLIVIVHDPRILELDLSKGIKIQQNKYNTIKIDKTEINRLPAPYPSKCSNNKGYDIFPGIYSRHSCILSYAFIEDYKKCGDTLDYVRKYIPEDIKRKYKKSKSIGETINCLKTFRKATGKLKDICSFPCNEFEFMSFPNFKTIQKSNKINELDHRHKYTVAFQYQKVDTYSIMEEKPLYKWDQLACEIGGFLGLVIGASILSVVEILVYIFLSIVKNFVCCK